jgi:asparagine synthase (glutamine-hydrolysing)
MCGICGIFDLTSQQRVNPALTRVMTACIAHRGPDGDGFYDSPRHQLSMGMRRLSIIDVDGSDQPLYNEDHSIAMVFNGEIYNYRELQADLRAAGHTLRTDGDGETLIHLYEQHGLDFFRHLRGMYAFAMWDSRHERLILAVDHIGMKPLYVREQDGMIYFASETKAIFATGAVEPDLNLGALDTYLSFGYPLGQDTLFAGIQRLMPGHVLIAEKGSIRTQQYWAFGKDYLSVEKGSQPESAFLGDNGSFGEGTDSLYINEARHALREAIMLHLRSDVPLGLFLSGGVDSATTLAFMAQIAQPPVQTYTVGFAGSAPDNELAQARRIASHFNTHHTERVITPQDWWDGLQRYAYHHDEPNANPSAISMLLLAEETAKHVKVVLTGLGGDELFGGYWHHRAIPALLQQQARFANMPGRSSLEKFLQSMEAYFPTFKRFRVIGALPTYLPRVRHALLPRAEGLRRMQSYDAMVFSDGLRDTLYGAELKAAWQSAQHKEHIYADILAQSWHENPARTAQALVINTWLTGNALLSQDKVTMAHSLEARVPFFDPALFKLAAKLPTNLLLRGNKYVLREAMRPYLPEFALQRPKQPFHTPIRGWFETSLRDNIRDVLTDSSAITRQLFNSTTLDALLNAHFAGQQKQEEVIFRLLNLELWHRAFWVEKRATMAAMAH